MLQYGKASGTKVSTYTLFNLPTSYTSTNFSVLTTPITNGSFWSHPSCYAETTTCAKTKSSFYWGAYNGGALSCFILTIGY